MPELPTVSVEVVAEACGIDVRRVQQLVKQGHMPKVRHGQYDLIKCMQGYIRFLQAQAGGGPADAHTEKTRLMTAQADKAELELAEKQGQLVAAEEVERRWNRIAENVRANILGVPSKLAPLAEGKAPAEIEALARDLIDEALEGVSGVAGVDA